jgi:hypothetical protein
VAINPVAMLDYKSLDDARAEMRRRHDLDAGVAMDTQAKAARTGTAPQQRHRGCPLRFEVDLPA